MNQPTGQKLVFVLIENDLRVLDNLLLDYVNRLDKPKQIIFLYYYDFNKQPDYVDGPHLNNICNNRRLKFILECIIEFKKKLAKLGNDLLITKCCVVDLIFENMAKDADNILVYSISKRNQRLADELVRRNSGN